MHKFGLRDTHSLELTMYSLQFPIVDPQTHIRQGYPPHDSGILEDVFIKDVTGQPFVGQVTELLCTNLHQHNLIPGNARLLALAKQAGILIYYPPEDGY